jgi:hypothetical protein
VGVDLRNARNIVARNSARKIDISVPSTVSIVVSVVTVMLVTVVVAVAVVGSGVSVEVARFVCVSVRVE